MSEMPLLKEKQAKVLLLLRDQSQGWYISSLAKSSGTTYVHTCNFLLACERLGLVTSEKHGRSKSIRLTEKGAALAESLSAVYTAVSAPLPRPQKDPQEGKDTVS